ncbi:E3 SUMO-protein ligase RanBP2 [Labeo rohita]|uniref:E3 SUMO-protein ligase RanBP2 n=1 Tax=Labeo rohita TaxID=84645 RepID=A0ABQ8MDK7_LABRO|nr:E3 SUMO-protein ligase RanBP2 [Labeo rohita]
METREKFLQNIQDREKDLNELKQAEESVKCSAQTAVAESERVFSDVVCAVQKTHVSVKELITERQRDELSHIEGLQEKVQQKISRMRMKVSELDQFMTTEDHIHFLQNYPSDCEESTSEEFQDLSSISENPKAFFRNVELLLSKMQERLLDVTKETEIKIKSGEADAPVSLAALFGKKYGQWDCETCLLVNEGTSGYCASCHGPKPNMKSESPSAPAFKFCFGRSGFKEPLESDLNAQIEKIKDKASPADFTFEPSATRKKNSAFSFSIPFPIPTAEFNFGSVSSSGFQLHAEPKKTETERVKSNFDEPIPTSSTFSFTDLLKTSQGSAQEDQKNVFRFGESTTEFNFSFQHVPLKSTSVEASGSDHEEEACKHEDDDTLDFEPVVPLPDLVEISSGEENEQVVFSHRAKLYRYDKELQQWKERGVGELKILQNNESRRARLVMRREQVLKLCANHWITTNMKLEPMKAAEKAWTWSAFDFADGDGSAETLAVRFRLRETADAFKKSFEEAVITSFNGAEREEQSAQERSDADVQIVFERKPTADQAELAAGLMLPHTFFCYRNDPGHASHEDDDDDEDFEGAVRSLKGKLYPDALAGCDAGAATETQNHEEEEKNDDDDEAVNNVELPSVEENEEEILFKQRTKLFLWDRDNNKWKSCGAGDIKILFHPVWKRYRVFMCQEKDKKLCANHCITRTTHPKPLHTNANALTWTAADYSDGDGVIQQFAAKFKTPDLTDSFKKTLTDCQCHVSEFMQPSKSKAVPHAKI